MVWCAHKTQWSHHAQIFQGLLRCWLQFDRNSICSKFNTLFQVQLPVDFAVGQRLKVTVPEGLPQVPSLSLNDICVYGAILLASCAGTAWYWLTCSGWSRNGLCCSSERRPWPIRYCAAPSQQVEYPVLKAQGRKARHQRQVLSHSTFNVNWKSDMGDFSASFKVKAMFTVDTDLKLENRCIILFRPGV